MSIDREVDHPLHNPHSSGFTSRFNPFTRKWEWWWLDSQCWRVIPSNRNTEDSGDTIVAYTKTWAEPTED